MTYIEWTMTSDDPAIAEMLRELNAEPRNSGRLRLEAALLQWLANHNLELAGASDSRDRMEAQKAARARATRESNRLKAAG